jgi:asparagine synthase (glutamine-hydrolysing)
LKYGKQKYLLKKLASKYIPYNAIYRKKRGFGIPLGYWFKNNLQFMIKEILMSDKALKRGYFVNSYVKNLAEEHLTGKHEHTYRLWALICLELWHLMFIDKIITAQTEFNY